MRNRPVQMSLFDIHNNISELMEQQKPELIRLLEEHIDFESLIPLGFHLKFYCRIGRKRIYHLESFIRSLVLQKILGIPSDTLLISILQCSRELQAFCGFKKIPDASQFTRFREDYADCLADFFHRLVELTEPVCREINEKKADYLMYDTTGVELPVAENNPKFLSTKLKEAKKIAKGNPNYDPYKGVYSLLPDASRANSDARQQYIDGHFCYAVKAGIATNGLGIVRHISFFDEDFRNRHPEVCHAKGDSPEAMKEIGDSSSLRPVLADFRKIHPCLSYRTFLGDAAFDSYDNYAMLKDEMGFERVCVPLNKRNAGKAAGTDASGTPVCPVDGTPFRYLGKSGGKNRSMRFKWVCHKSEARGNTRVCTCDHPCTKSTYGKCAYTYPGKDFRLYPGIARGTEHWKNLYRHRVAIERTINLMKGTFVLDSRRSHRTVSAKADLYLAGIVQLIGVLLAKSMHKIELYKSVRRLIVA